MNLKKWKLFCGVCFCGAILAAGPRQRISRAETTGYIEGIGVETSSSYRLTVDAPTVTIYREETTFSEPIGTADRGQVFDVISYEAGWALIGDETEAGYVKLSDGAILVEVTQEKVNEDVLLRQQVVEYALQFVGGRYVWGGTDPHTGADCSGFTSYVMRHAAGIELSHSSRAQAGEGRTVSEPKPGDLVFYSSGGKIDHVALYIGGGKVVHASTEKTGIKISALNHRRPVKIVDVLP